MKCSKNHKAKIFLTGLFSVTAVLLLLAGSASADQVNVKWDGGGGTNSWNNADNWDPGVIPNNNTDTYNVFIGGSSLPDYIVYIDNIDPTIDNLTIDTGDSLTINDRRGLSLASGASAGTITNNGTILLNGSTGATTLRLNRNTTLTGTGVLNLSNSLSDNVITDKSGAILTNDTNHTIQGSGQLGNARLGIINNGTIIANQSEGLIINPNPGAGGFTNNGTIRANSASTLTVNDNLNNLSGNTLTGGTYYVAGTMRLPGAININAASIILDGTGSNLYNGATGTNNALANFATNASGGSFSILDSRNFNTVSNLDNSGAITIGSGITLNVNGSYNQSSTGSLSGAGTLISNAIMNTGTLSGSTTSVGSVTNQGIVSPGTSPGILNITGNYAQIASGILKIDISGLTPGSEYDQLIISGLASLAGELDVSLFGSYIPDNGDYFNILLAQDISGEFSKYDFPTLPSGFFNISYILNPNDTDFVRLTYVSKGPAPVPEPPTIILLGSGLIGLVGYGRKKFFKK
jgi:hypothetical protein